MGILEILTVIFLVLKLLGLTAVATWGWPWIFAPLWLGYPASLLFYLLIFKGFVAFFSK